MILPTAGNIVTAAGDAATFASEGGGNWKCLSYQRANGSPVAAGVDIAGSTEVVAPIAVNDEFIEYSQSATANRKIKAKNLFTRNIQQFTAGEALSIGDAVYVSVADSKVYKTAANNPLKTRFMGFVLEAVSANAAVSVDIGGVTTTKSGLAANSVYYLSDTSGAISTTPGTWKIPVGFAFSATQLLTYSESPTYDEDLWYDREDIRPCFTDTATNRSGPDGPVGSPTLGTCVYNSINHTSGIGGLLWYPTG